MTADSEVRSFPDFLKMYWGPMSGIASIVAMLAVGSTTLRVVASQQEHMLTDLAAIQHSLDEHERQPAHAVSVLRFQEIDRRIEANAIRMQDIERRQRDDDHELRVQLDAINKNITALCVATRGAPCVIR